MHEFTYENIIRNERVRTKFLFELDRLIDSAKRHGYMEQVVILKKNRKMLMEEIELLA